MDIGTLEADRGGSEPAARLWAGVVAAADATSDPLARSLRVLLWLAAQRETGASVWRSSIVMAAMFRNLMRPVRRRRLDVEKGGILVCLPHSTPACIANLIPIARAAYARGRLGAILASRTDLSELQEFRGRVPIIGFRDLFYQTTYAARLAALKHAVRAQRGLKMAIRNQSEELTQKLRKGSLERISELQNSALMGSQFGLFLQTWCPSAIVSSSDFFPTEFQLIFQARELGIPTAVVQHGIIGTFWWPFTADFDLVWGDFFRDQLLGMDVPAQRVVVCGMPALDRLFLGQVGQAPVAVTRGARACLLISHTHAAVFQPKIYEAFGKLLHDVVAADETIHWKVKLHPSEDDSFYRGLGSEILARIEILPRNTSLCEAVLSSAVSCTLYSTAGLEAMALSRPVVVLDVLPSVRSLAWWPRLGGGIYAGTSRSVLETVKALFPGGSQRAGVLLAQDEFLSKAFANPGRAASSVVDFLEEVAMRGKQ